MNYDLSRSQTINFAVDLEAYGCIAGFKVANGTIFAGVTLIAARKKMTDEVRIQFMEIKLKLVALVQWSVIPFFRLSYHVLGHRLAPLRFVSW